MNRRAFVASMITAAAAEPPDYRRPSFAPLRDSGYGVGFHWKPEIVARRGDAKSFPDAVRDVDVKAFVQQVDAMGVGHVLFTLAHGHRCLCAPNPEVDRILKGRTVERDLILDIANELVKRKRKLIVYYNIGGDAEWNRATGMTDRNAKRFFQNWIRIFTWMGEHYRDQVAAWWVDSTQAYQSVGTPPWKEMAAAAHAGFPDRLVCFNSGLESLNHTTLYQDFWAGELARLNWNPRGDSANGLPWYSFTSWHSDSRRRLVGEWFLTPENAAQDWLGGSPSHWATGLCGRRGFQRTHANAGSWSAGSEAF